VCRRFLAVGALLASLAVSERAFAQNVGSIQGIASDVTGGALPGVTIVIRNVATGDTRELVTDKLGPLPRTSPAAGRIRAASGAARLPAARAPRDRARWQRVTDAKSFYNALQVGVNKRFSHGWRAQASSTLSRSIDDSSGINSQDFSNVVQYGLDWYDPEFDRGLSAFHAKHNLTFNGSWELPMFRGSNRLAGALLGGWQLNNITTLRSGHPFTVQLGFNRSGNLNTTGLVNADGSPAIAPTWGRITSTVTTSRQIQLGAKLAF
jgi:hypothetical protein